MPPRISSNKLVADLLDGIAGLLEAKEESPFRVRSYRNAATTVRTTRRSVAKIIRTDGEAGLTELKGIGENLAGLIREFVETGESELLASLQAEVPPEKAGAAVSPTRPREPKGKRAATTGIQVPVSVILEIDEQYRRKAAANELKKIAPRLMNPDRKAWLPLLATKYKALKFTVMFSNTPRAHELGKTNDWVVVYYEKGKGENQCTVVTESRGELKGKRVIRGRESDCADYYRKRKR